MEHLIFGFDFDVSFRFSAYCFSSCGKNVADFIDPDILTKLEALEKEEEQLELAYQQESDDDVSDIDEEDRRLVTEIRKRRKVIVARLAFTVPV